MVTRSPNSLYDYLRGPKPRMTPSEVVSAFRPLLTELEALHRTGLLHGSLRPDTVVLNWQGKLRLSPFVVTRERTVRVNRAPSPALKERFLPPHRWGHGAAWSVQNDLWQVGQLMVATLQGDPLSVIHAGQVRTLNCSNWLQELIYRAIGPKSVSFGSAIEMQNAFTAKELAIRDIPHARPSTLKGKVVTFTSGMPGLPREIAGQLALRAGATAKYDLSDETDYLVVGDLSSQYATDAAGNKLISALVRNKKGAEIKLITSTQFQALARA